MPVVRVEHDVLARHDVVGGERERDAAGPGVAGQRRDDHVRVGLDDVAHDVVDRVEVAPRLAAGSSAASMTLRWMPLEKKSRPPMSTITRVGAPRRVAVGLEQPAALVGAHRAVVEGEVQVADAGALLVADLAVRPGRRRACSGAGTSRASQRARRRARAPGSPGSLNAPGRLEVRDPDRAVDGRAADRAVALGDELAGPAAQRALAVGAEEVERLAADAVEHARVAVGGADPAQHRRRWRRALQSIARSACFSSGRGRPTTSRVAVVERLGRDVAGGHVARRPRTTASTAARRTSWR